MASLITSFSAWHFLKFNLAACALGTQWVSLNFTAVSFHSLCDTFLSTFDSSVISSNCAFFFPKCLYHNNLAEQVGEDNSDTVANLCTKVIYEKPGQLASVFHIWQQKGAASLSVSLKTVKSAVKELAVRGTFYFLQANHSFILKADLVDCCWIDNPRLLDKPATQMA